MSVIQNKFFGRTATGQTLDQWQMGNPETLLDVIKELRQLQRTLANNDRLMQAFFEKFHNPFQTGLLVINAQTMFSFAISQCVITGGAIQLGKSTNKDNMQAPGNYGGSRVEVYPEGSDPTANPGGSDDLTTIYGPPDWNDQKGPETCELVFLQRGGNSNITVYNGFGANQIRLDQNVATKPLIDDPDTLVLMKGGIGPNWIEVAHTFF